MGKHEMVTNFKFLIICFLAMAVLSAGLIYYFGFDQKAVIGEFVSVNQHPRIQPDYAQTIIPSNIAPLNFVVLENGSNYCVKIHSKQGVPIEVFSRTPKIVIPQTSWRKLLAGNKGQELYFDVFVKNKDGQWKRFLAITNKIAAEDIDAFLVYRKITPSHILYSGKQGIYQRNLSNYDESVILDNGYSMGIGCLNCHTFCNNSPDKTLIAVRDYKTENEDTIMISDGTAKKVGGRFGFTSWHPSGRLFVFSKNDINLFFLTSKEEVRDAVDLDSSLAYYIINSNTIKILPISRKGYLENWPCWSPDGRYLYFCRATKLWPDKTRVPPERYNEVKYDIVRVSYDIEHDKWGDIETIVSAQDTGMSNMQPRVSPDGRWLLFSMCGYGFWPIWQKDTDLYLIDLEAAGQNGQYKYRRLDINSDQCDSWHSFSSNSRWIVFSSKRTDGVFARPYLSYIDQTGKVYKPLLLPQKDPVFYESCLKVYTNPEFVTAPVAIPREKLGRIFRGADKILVNAPAVKESN